MLAAKACARARGPLGRAGGIAGAQGGGYGARGGVAGAWGGIAGARGGPTACLQVPFDILGGESPEDRSAGALRTLCTFVALRVVMEQMRGTRHASPLYTKLVDYLAENPLKNGEAWLAGLMRHEETEMRLAALRVLETRAKYVETTFDWGVMQSAVVEGIESENATLRKNYLMDSFQLDSDVDSGDFDSPQDGEGREEAGGPAD